MTTDPADLPQKKSQYETKLQIYLVQTFRKHVQPWDAILAMIANGGYRPPETVGLLARMGLVPGWPDLELKLHNGRSRLIEVKLERTLHHDRTTLRGDQREIADLLVWMGHTVDVVRNLGELWMIVEEEEIPNTLTRLPAEQATFDFRRRRPRAKVA